MLWLLRSHKPTVSDKEEKVLIYIKKELRDSVGISPVALR